MSFSTSFQCGEPGTRDRLPYSTQTKPPDRQQDGSENHAADEVIAITIHAHQSSRRRSRDHTILLVRAAYSGLRRSQPGMRTCAYSRPLFPKPSLICMELAFWNVSRTFGLLTVAGFALVVAGLDFVVRRRRVLAMATGEPSPTSRLAESTLREPPRPVQVAAQPCPVAERQPAAPATSRWESPRRTAGPSLHLAELLSMPQPGPKCLPHPKPMGASLAWWQATPRSIQRSVD